MARRTHDTSHRPEIIENAPMQYAPQNELGVVFLFAHVARKFRLKVERIRPQYPDCIAYRKTGKGERRIRIEFEFRSRNFRIHQHKARKCDCLICWEHNWPGIPKKIQVIELRRLFGLGFNVWVQPVDSPYKESLREYNSCRWSVPSLASKGDLLLFYSTAPDACIGDVFVLTSGVTRRRANWRRNVKGGRWKGEFDCYADLRRVCKLQSPIFLSDLRADRVLQTANFVRARMQGRSNASEYWPYLYDRIVRRNRKASVGLRRYAPDRL